jgi:hypothetical protein
MDSFTSKTPDTTGMTRAPEASHKEKLPPVTVEVRPSEALRFPAEDGGRSLSDMAQRDLDAALRLLVERAQYITGASGAAIAIGDVQRMLCCASCGPCAPKMGASLEANSGLSGESIRSKRILCCNNAAEDPRVDRESCQALGIASAMVMPLQRHEKVVGIFEIFSSRPHAFEERDLTALQRLGEMIITAIEHAEAARDARALIAAAGVPFQPSHEELAQSQPESLLPRRPVILEERGPIGECTDCGFPVSVGRTLCLDCENSRKPEAAQKPLSFRDLAGSRRPAAASWLQSHKYLVGTMVVAAIAATALIFLR